MESGQGTHASPGWHARLALRYSRSGERTVATRRHDGPLLVQRSFYPEGPTPCQNLVVHPPGGLVGGDVLEISIDADPESFAQLSTPGATRWYRSAGPWAEQRVSIEVGQGATVEWLPQESIVFDRARARARTRVSVAPGGCFVGWDVFCLGRAAAGESCDGAQIVIDYELARGGELLWVERAAIGVDSRVRQSAVALAGHRVFGTLVACAPPIDGALRDACRQIAPVAGDAVVTTPMPGLLAARYRGDSTEAARAWFVALWSCIRPALTGRPALTPRIWRT